MLLKIKPVKLALFLTILGAIAAVLLFRNLVSLPQIVEIVHQSGSWGVIVFGAAYVIATLLVLPSTAFNIAGGAIFGVGNGLAIATLASIVAAVIAFALARYWGKRFTENFRAPAWQDLNDHLQVGGIPYATAVRFLPIFPYGVVSFMAGLSRIRTRDYLIGTLIGTPLGLAPFVWLGDSGLQAIAGNGLMPLILSSAALSLLVIGSTWYQQNRAVESRRKMRAI